MRTVMVIAISMTAFVAAVFSSFASETDTSTPGRKKRHLPLMFEDFGVSQFVCGFGIPIESDTDSVISGMVFKSQFPLPTKPKDLRNHTSHNINGRLIDNLNDLPLLKQMRWHLYNAMGLWASSIGLNGHTCVLKSLCEANQVPFNNDSGDLWHEIAHIIFSPFSSKDDLVDHLSKDYITAAKIGLTHKCDEVFKECPKSLLQIVSEIL